MLNKKLVINRAWCKGCGICAAFCPKKVLAVKDEKVYAENLEASIPCRQSEPRRPAHATYLAPAAAGN